MIDARTVGAARATLASMRLLLLLALLLPACTPSLNNDDDDAVGDDDDATGDDDDATGDDDDATGDDDDATGDDDDSVGTPAMAFRSSFGECWGECRTDLAIDDGGLATWRVYGWEDETYVLRDGSLSGYGAITLTEANASIDLDLVEPVYGCPDCADGGAREILWDFGSLARVTSYEYGDPPDILWPLVEVLLELEREISTCNYGTWFDSIPDCDPIPG